jgi:hypothetical protein
MPESVSRRSSVVATDRIVCPRAARVVLRVRPCVSQDKTWPASCSRGARVIALEYEASRNESAVVVRKEPGLATVTRGLAHLGFRLAYLALNGPDTEPAKAVDVVPVPAGPIAAT